MKKLLSVVFLVAVLLFTLAFLYSCFAGEWASSMILDTPPNSTLASDYHYEQYGYNNHLKVYSTQTGLQEIRHWYSERIAMSPIDQILSDDDTQYCSLGIPVEKSVQYQLLFTTAFVSLNPNLGRYPIIPDCFSVCVATTLPTYDYEVLKLSAITIPEGGTVVLLNTCWPDW